MKLRHPSLIYLAAWLLSVIGTVGMVEPYPLAHPTLASPFYEVTLSQGTTEIAAPVMFSSAQKRDSNPHADTSWAAFAFEGPVSITLRRLGHPISTARVLPSARGITPVVSVQGEVTFSVSAPGQFAIELDGQLGANPLLIFADPPETEIPDQNDPKVRWFSPGIHSLGTEVQTVSSGETLYFAPGSLVYGCFKGDDAADVRLLGRGILAGTIYPPNPPNTYTAPHLFELAGSSDQTLVDGITFLDSPHYNLLLRGNRCTVRNVKMIGWWYGTDGVGVGADSLVENSFFKVNDDTFKLYRDNMVVRGCTVWQMENGMPFQLSWNLNQDASHVRVSDCDVIRVEHYKEANNRAVFGSIHGGSGNLSDYIFENIRIEGPIFRLVKLTALLTSWSRSPVAGTISHLTFRDIYVEGPVLQSNLIQSLEATGRFEDITFQNLVVEGQLITESANASFKIDPASTARIRFIP